MGIRQQTNGSHGRTIKKPLTTPSTPPKSPSIPAWKSSAPITLYQAAKPDPRWGGHPPTGVAPIPRLAFAYGIRQMPKVQKPEARTESQCRLRVLSQRPHTTKGRVLYKKGRRNGLWWYFGGQYHCSWQGACWQAVALHPVRTGTPAQFWRYRANLPGFSCL